MKTIIVEGASTAYGANDLEKGGWATRLHLDALAKNLGRITNPTVIANYASPGRVLTRIVKEFPQRAAMHGTLGPVATALSVGVNEAKVFFGNKEPIITQARFQDCLEGFIDLAEAAQVTPVLVGPQPLAVPRITSAITGCTTEDAMVQAYGDIMEHVADKTGVQYVDTRLLFEAQGLAHVLDKDGCHPNPLGHAILYDAIGDALRNVDAL